MYLTEVLSQLENTYKSIDLCVSCVFHEGKWINVFTLLRFVHEDADFLKENSEKPHLTDLGKGKRFRIYRKSFPIKDFEELADNFLNGSMKIGDIVVSYLPTDIKNFDVSYRRPASISDEWGAYFVARDMKSDLRSKLPFDSFKTDVIPYGAEDIFAAIRDYFNFKEFVSTYVA